MNYCQDCDDPDGPPEGCGIIADPEYTMDFSDIGKPPIFWCTNCGKRAKAMNELLQEAFKKDATFAGRLKKEIDKVSPS